MSASMINAGRVSDSVEKTFVSSSTIVAPTTEKVILPTQVIEKAVAVHEEIRREMVEEIQPVINVEKLKTEVHQVTQPLFDKEVKPVLIEQKILSTEVLPEVLVKGRGARSADDVSTTTLLKTHAVVVEKPAMYVEVEKKQIIEEIQPVIYKETVVPSVIQETKPMFQKIVEGPVYTQETLSAKGMRSAEEIELEASRNAYVPSTEVTAPILAKMSLPVQVVEKPAAVHEEIRKETVEEIQPIVNIEKLTTEVHQITAPLFDKEVLPVMIEKKILATEVLPEVLVEGRGVRSVDDSSTVKMLPTHAMTIEKPAMYMEVEKKQIIEEIQPVIYKETIVPSVIQETKPIYQKIVEGAVYTQTTLPAQEVAIKSTIAPAYVPDTTVVAPTLEKTMLPTQIIEKPAAIHEEIRKEVLEEIQPVVNIEKLKTEVHQVTQPLFDKETKPVMIEKKILATEVLPEVLVEGQGFRSDEEINTTSFLPTHSLTVEKPALFREVEKMQIIQEIQPVIYKETIVPSVIQETKPIYQKIVQGAVYTQTTLPAQEVAVKSTIAPAYVPNTTVVAPVHSDLLMPTQIIEKTAALHETIRKEMVEEIQPVINIETMKTEVHQVTQPLFDKEVKPVMIEKRVLKNEMLPEVFVEGRGHRAIEDHSTTRMVETDAVIVEKAAMFIEVEKTQIIEEIQPVIYKETIVPTVIQETKPIYQKIIQGPVYVKETLAPRSLAGTNYHYPTSYVSGATMLTEQKM